MWVSSRYFYAIGFLILRSFHVFAYPSQCNRSLFSRHGLLGSTLMRLVFERRHGSWWCYRQMHYNVDKPYLSLCYSTSLRMLTMFDDDSFDARELLSKKFLASSSCRASKVIGGKPNHGCLPLRTYFSSFLRSSFSSICRRNYILESFFRFLKSMPLLNSTRSCSWWAVCILSNKVSAEGGWKRSGSDWSLMIYS